MTANINDEIIDLFIRKLNGLSDDPDERVLLTRAIRALDLKYMLGRKIEREPGVAEIVAQMTGRLFEAVGRLSNLRGLKILDIACGSNTSKAPSSIYINTPFGEINVGRPAKKGYTAQFEPWFCRLLIELGADPVGLDLGDLESEAFKHYRVDLGKPGALDFLPEHSFDGIQDSRLFGSPEFTAQFPNPIDRLKVAEEIRRQEQRLLKTGGIMIHSDAQEL
jgi:hypothetical protein